MELEAWQIVRKRNIPEVATYLGVSGKDFGLVGT